MAFTWVYTNRKTLINRLKLLVIRVFVCCGSRGIRTPDPLLVRNKQATSNTLYTSALPPLY